MDNIVVPHWPAPKNVKAFASTRFGGESTGQYQGLNLGMHVGDNAEIVQRNRDLITQRHHMPTAPVWLNQTHSTEVVELVKPTLHVLNADGSFTRHNKMVCVVMTADCLPILLANIDGTQVAAVHAGWRGLADGIVENAVQQFDNPNQVMAWVGPAIGPQAFEVGADVYQTFVQHHSQAKDAFYPHPTHDDKWLADMSQLATQRLNHSGVEQVYLSHRCTYSEPNNFYSYRRDGVTGRQATFIWME